MLPQVNALIVLFQAPSTRIRIFLNPQVFLSGFKNFRSTRIPIKIKFACPHVSVTYADSLYRKCVVKRARFASCSACPVKNWARSCYVTG